MGNAGHALRLLAKSPGFTITILATLALGIGANTAVFSIIDGALLRPLPYKDPGGLIDILDTSPREKGLARIFAAYADFEEFAQHARTLQHVAATTWAGSFEGILTGRGPAKSYLTIPVTADFFTTLGVAAQRGRTFTNADLRGGCAVVLSDRFWHGPLNADPSIVGQSLSLDDHSCTVLGVMPPTFAFYPRETQIWTLLLPGDPRLKRYFGVFMVARLKPGATAAQAQAELRALHTPLHAGDKNGENEFTPLVSGLQDQFTWFAGRNLRSTLGALFAAVLAVLSIACLNIANLLLERSFARSREFAIRSALGSGRARLIRQLLVEGTILSLAGAALGLLVAFAAIRYFVHLQPIELPVGAAISISLPALAFTAALSIVTSAVFALAPSWAISREDINAVLRANGVSATSTRQRLSRFLVSAEVALSVILLAGAGLLMRSVIGFGSAPLGFSPDSVLTANGSLPQSHHRDAARKAAFYDELQRKLGSLPGVQSAAVASTLPPYGLGLNAVEIQGRPVSHSAQMHDTGLAAVGPDYFRVLNVPLHRGRVFGPQDQPQSEQVAVVNEALVHEYFPGRDPVGERLRLGADGEWLTVVGVAGTERRPQVFQEMSWTDQPAVYRPLDQAPPGSFSIALRVNAGQAGIGHFVEQTIASIDSGVAIGEVLPMRSRLAPYLTYPRFRAVVLAAFASLAILLAAVGLYGVLAQFVTQSTREIGLRMAVGARAGNIAALVARKGGVPVIAGLIAGLLWSFALTRYLSSFLYGVTPADPLTFATVPIVMLAAASLAMILPARRASRIDPMTALRSE
jgi:putative ABC transport system permease protein